MFYGKASAVRQTESMTTRQPPGRQQWTFPSGNVQQTHPLLPAMQPTSSRTAAVVITFWESSWRSSQQRVTRQKMDLKLLKWKGSSTNRPTSFLSPSAFKPALHRSSSEGGGSQPAGDTLERGEGSRQGTCHYVL